MFPTLTAAQIATASRFGGPPQRYEPNQAVVEMGQVAAPAFLVLAGYLEVSRRDALGKREVITRHQPGQFAGEISQLGGGPSFVDVVAGPEGCEAIPFDAMRVRTLVVSNADVGEILMRAFILRRVGLIETGAGTAILGYADSADALRLQNFLTRNAVPFLMLDPRTDPEAREVLERLPIESRDLPIAICPDGRTLNNPTAQQLAQCLGLLPDFSQNNSFDVAIVGAGPAGLATAVYAASEGLSVVVLDSRSFGGQAGASARIENYLGFPTGISGMALAGRAFSQAQKFGATIAIPVEALRLSCGVHCAMQDKLATPTAFGQPVKRQFELKLDDAQRVRASTVVIATGARYRRPNIPDLELFEGHGVYYWASPLEAKLSSNQEVALIGGGNSAGQAAVFLAGHASKVHMLVRGPSLAASMSRYLIDRIEALSNVELHTETELTGLRGTREDGLRGLTWRSRRTGEEQEYPINFVFLFIGADPNADWVKDCSIAVDAKGFVKTGLDVERGVALPQEILLDAHRAPLPLETTQPGVFAVGDVRAGSVKRVSSAVGEGAAVVAQIHSFLSATPAWSENHPLSTVSRTSTSTGLTR
ncbi:MAG TPA: FAD-dependent oxidoreductase [Steroidobacteraceae bacterium]|nr:FAD-dependent oxidoreductase [Steroidobacteraceae bacterium]